MLVYPQIVVGGANLKTLVTATIGPLIEQITLSFIISAHPEMRNFGRVQVSADSEACDKFYHRHIVDIPRIKF